MTPNAERASRDDDDGAKGMTKLEQERRRMYPLSYGGHTVKELATLVADGLSYRQIAARWGMRPQAGRQDLEYDLWDAWVQAGQPGGIPEPDGHGPAYEAGWAAWRAARDEVIPAWMESVRTGVAFTSRGDLLDALRECRASQAQLAARLARVTASVTAVLEHLRSNEYANNFVMYAPGQPDGQPIRWQQRLSGVLEAALAEQSAPVEDGS